MHEHTQTHADEHAHTHTDSHKNRCTSKEGGQTKIQAESKSWSHVSGSHTCSRTHLIHFKKAARENILQETCYWQLRYWRSWTHHTSVGIRLPLLSSCNCQLSRPRRITRAQTTSVQRASVSDAAAHRWEFIYWGAKFISTITMSTHAPKPCE